MSSSRVFAPMGAVNAQKNRFGRPRRRRDPVLSPREEAAIRKDPAKRTTEILTKVFGAL